ncbi:glycoside hydrolase family 20 zincin-like fold domain-containing protein [Photobacterium leiognathi]|uniref:glycoside hydrolase family 20 zincin-like fold domain-containing protein n=1 Tax=Photobacterium leiognathi TaxID=553611 RepID=UPI0027325F19|nr:glycoside hydrolase family 20 zincin-like fold domain-containing protein [Photobacterium leiognathi]
MYIQRKNKPKALALHKALLHELKNNTPKITAASTAPDTKVIRLIDHDIGNEAYTLNISKNHIDLLGNDAGLFYAQISLLSLIQQHGSDIPNVIINDEPRKPYRGFLLDVARNFYKRKLFYGLIKWQPTK